MKKILHFIDPINPIPFLKNKEINNIRDRKFQLDCSNILLKKLHSNTPDEYYGPGYIKQTLDGNLIFKIYSNRSLSAKDVFDEASQAKAGKLILANEYYKLTACDIYYREWKCGRILPDFQSSSNGTVITGKIDQIKTIMQNFGSTNKKQIKFLSFEKVEIPANTQSESNVNIAGNEIKSLNLNVARFKSNELTFQLTNMIDRLELFVEPEIENFPIMIENRIHESLLFVLGRKIKWSIIEKTEEEYVQIRIISSNVISKQNSLTPLINHPIDYTRDAWVLFDKYFQYILKDQTSNWHPLSCRINSFIDSQKSSNAIQCLILCISIEGILEDEFSDISPPSAEYLALWKKTKQKVDKWKTESKKNLKDTNNEKEAFKAFFDRLNGVLALIKNSRAKDKMEILAKASAIEDNHMKAWTKTRPKVSHGGSLNPIDTESLVDIYFKLVTLFYNLIFHRIGYIGSYSNYSKKGFPVENYPLK